jgi:diamine N-acetyltransferase
MILENKNIRLRAIEPSDVDIIYEWENNTETWKVSNTITPFSRNIISAYIEHAHLDIYQTKQLRLIIELKENKLPIGTIDLFDFEPFNKRAGVGILIAEDKNKQKGYASEALETLIEYSFEVLKLNQLFCNISETNPNSLFLFEKYGFEITGRKKQWIIEGKDYKDELFLQLLSDKV